MSYYFFSVGFDPSTICVFVYVTKFVSEVNDILQGQIVLLTLFGVKLN